MRRALGELDQNTPVALRRSPRACVARVGAETPSRARVETVESVEPQTTTRQHNAAALDAAVALLRERNVESPRPSDPGHLKYKDALTKAGYRGDNGVVVLSKRLGAEKRRVDADSAANVLIDMSQLSKAQKSLRSAIDGLDDVKTLAEQFDALVGDGKFSDPTEREFVENLIASHT